MTSSLFGRGKVLKRDGDWTLTLRPITGGHRLQEFDGAKPARYWCYATPEAAVLAARLWTPAGEMVGWFWEGGAVSRTSADEKGSRSPLPSDGSGSGGM